MTTKIPRETMLIFGSTAGTDQIEQFGSLANGTPVYTTSISAIQALANYLDGWFGGVVGSNAPAIEDLNAICYLYAYQLAYMFQQGVPEWDSSTTYFIGSIAQDGSGNEYVSQTNGNLNHVLSDQTNWKPKTSNFGGFTSITAAGGVTVLTSLSPTLLYVIGSSNQSINLPSALTLPTGIRYTIRNLGTGIVNVYDETGIDLLMIMYPEDSNAFELNGNSTAAGSWLATGTIGCQYTASGTTVSSGVTATVVWTTANYDSTSGGPASTGGLWTCPSPGKYKITVALQITTGTITTAQPVNVSIIKNSTLYYEQQHFVNANVSASTQTFNLVIDIPLIATDTIKTTIFTNATTPAIAISSSLNILSISRIN